MNPPFVGLVIYLILIAAVAVRTFGMNRTKGEFILGGRRLFTPRLDEIISVRFVSFSVALAAACLGAKQGEKRGYGATNR